MGQGACWRSQGKTGEILEKDNDKCTTNMTENMVKKMLSAQGTLKRIWLNVGENLNAESVRQGCSRR